MAEVAGYESTLESSGTATGVLHSSEGGITYFKLAADDAESSFAGAFGIAVVVESAGIAVIA
jgi:hypothetical protein